MKAPVTLSGCGAFVVSGASVPVPKSPRFHPSNPTRTETVSVFGIGRAGDVGIPAGGGFAQTVPR